MLLSPCINSITEPWAHWEMKRMVLEGGLTEFQRMDHLSTWLLKSCSAESPHWLSFTWDTNIFVFALFRDANQYLFHRHPCWNFTNILLPRPWTSVKPLDTIMNQCKFTAFYICLPRKINEQLHCSEAMPTRKILLSWYPLRDVPGRSYSNTTGRDFGWTPTYHAELYKLGPCFFFLIQLVMRELQMRHEYGLKEKCTKGRRPRHFLMYIIVPSGHT